MPTLRGAVYCLARPAEHIGYGISGGIARSRPLINTRDEPRAAAEGVRRLRVSISDPNMSGTSTLLKAGTTDLVLRMAEAATVMPDLALDDPVRALDEVSRDITGRSLIRPGERPRAERPGHPARVPGQGHGLRGHARRGCGDRRVLGMWGRALEAIAAGDLDPIAQEIDWVIKYQLIERYRAAHDLPLSAPQVALADLAYHDIDRGRGLYYLLQRSGAVDRTARDVDIFEAKTLPPDPGRYRQAG